MDQAGEGALGVFLLQHVAGLGVGVAGMDDQRQAGLARRRDMGAEALGLLGARAVLVIEIEAGLADADHLGMAAPPRSAGRGCVAPPPSPRADGRRPSTRHCRGARRSRAPARTGRAACRWSACRRRPAVRARASTPVSSPASSGKSRWQWLSISIRRQPLRLDVAREHALRLGQAGARLQLGVERGERPPSAGTPSWSRILAVDVRHERLHQQGHPPDRLGQHPQHRVAPHRIGLGERPRRLRVDVAVGVADHFPDRGRARDGRPARRARRARSPAGPWRGRAARCPPRSSAPLARDLLAAALGDDRQHPLAEIAVGVGEVAVEAADQGAPLEVAVVAERHLAQQEVAHRIEPVGRPPGRPDRSRCRATWRSSGPRSSTSRARRRAAAARGPPPSGRPARTRNGSG